MKSKALKPFYWIGMVVLVVSVACNIGGAQPTQEPPAETVQPVAETEAPPVETEEPVVEETEEKTERLTALAM